MNDTPNQMLERAIKVAVNAHADQTDKAGEAYILHPLRVMLAVREQGGSTEQQAAAVLHDVLEDCDVSEDYPEERFPAEVCDIVDALTHQEGEGYEAFLRRVAQTPGALLVKEADIRDNHGRLHLLSDETTRFLLKLAVLDIIPTIEQYARADMQLGMRAWHWFFLPQPADFPERAINAARDVFFERRPTSAFTPEARAEYKHGGA